MIHGNTRTRRIALALATLSAQLPAGRLDRALGDLEFTFPATDVYRGERSPAERLAATEDGITGREEALARGKRALELFVIEGVKTTIPLHRRLIEARDVREGNTSTKWLERWLKESKD